MIESIDINSSWRAYLLNFSTPSIVVLIFIVALACIGYSLYMQRYKGRCFGFCGIVAVVSSVCLVIFELYHLIGQNFLSDVQHSIYYFLDGKSYMLLTAPIIMFLSRKSSSAIWRLVSGGVLGLLLLSLTPGNILLWINWGGLSGFPPQCGAFIAIIAASLLCGTGIWITRGSRDWGRENGNISLDKHSLQKDRFRHRMLILSALLSALCVSLMMYGNSTSGNNFSHEISDLFRLFGNVLAFSIVALLLVSIFEARPSKSCKTAALIYTGILVVGIVYSIAKKASLGASFLGGGAADGYWPDILFLMYLYAASTGHNNSESSDILFVSVVVLASRMYSVINIAQLPMEFQYIYIGFALRYVVLAVYSVYLSGIFYSWKQKRNSRRFRF